MRPGHLRARRMAIELATLLSIVGALACAKSEVGSASSSTTDRGGGTRPESAPVEFFQPVQGGFAKHVLLITIDTLRFDALGFMGNDEAATPTMDALATSGLVFERAHAHNVFTLPSHANILTGVLPYQHGIRDNAGFVLPDDIPTLATVLGDSGFETAAFVAAFPLDARYGLDRGFDRYDDSYPEGASRGFQIAERRGDDVVEDALDWWQAAAGTSEEPTKRFLWLHLYDPHAPYQPEPRFLAGGRTPYLGEVSAVDSYLAPLLQPLLDSKPDDHLVILTSDHGESLGEHGEQTHGLFAYDATLRVPLVLWAGPRLSGRRLAQAAHVDIMPTILDAAGAEAPESLMGESLLGDLSTERSVYFEALGASLHRGWAPLRGLIRANRKAIQLPLPELYDLDSDPEERNNLVPGSTSLFEDIVEHLPQESVWPPTAGRVSPEEEKRLRSLGYLTSTGNAGESTTFGPEHDPKNLVHVDALVHDYVQAYQRGDLVTATQRARQLVAEQPDMALGYWNLAQVLLEQGDPNAALATMSDAYRRGLREARLMRQLALTLAEGGRFQEAIRILRPLVEASSASADPDLLNVFGLVLAEAGSLDEAEQVLSSIFTVDERNPQAEENLALVSLHHGDWVRCEQRARKALELNDQLPLAWNYLGIALYNQKRASEAIAAWQRSVELDGRDYDVLYNLGVVASETGNTSVARDALSRFVAEAPPQRYAADIDRARQLLGGIGP